MRRVSSPRTVRRRGSRNRPHQQHNPVRSERRPCRSRRICTRLPHRRSHGRCQHRRSRKCRTKRRWRRVKPIRKRSKSPSPNVQRTINGHETTGLIRTADPDGRAGSSQNVNRITIPLTQRIPSLTTRHVRQRIRVCAVLTSDIHGIRVQMPPINTSGDSHVETFL